MSSTATIRALIQAGEYRAASDACREQISGIEWNDDTPENDTITTDSEWLALCNECHCARLLPQDRSHFVSCALLRLAAMDGDEVAAGALLDKITASGMIAQMELELM